MMGTDSIHNPSIHKYNIPMKRTFLFFFTFSGISGICIFFYFYAIFFFFTTFVYESSDGVLFKKGFPLRVSSESLSMMATGTYG